MKDNVYDSVLNKVMARVDKASGDIASNFKGVKPFDKEPIPNKELLGYYQQLTPQDMQYLIQTHGADKVDSFIADMENLRSKQNA